MLKRLQEAPNGLGVASVSRAAWRKCEDTGMKKNIGILENARGCTRRLARVPRFYFGKEARTFKRSRPLRPFVAVTRRGPNS